MGNKSKSLSIDEMQEALTAASIDFGFLVGSAIKAHRLRDNQYAINDCQGWANSVKLVLDELGPFLRNYSKLLKLMDGRGDHNATDDVIEMKITQLRFIQEKRKRERDGAGSKRTA
jgi:hypothetical protein